MEFENRLIVITGGAGGIARVTAELLLAQGAELLLIDPDASALAMAAAELVPSARVGTVVSALESPQACVAALAGVERPIYGLVHLAGIFRPDVLDGAHRPLWDATIAANLTNAFDMAAAVRPMLDAGATCRMVFASSLAYRRGSFDHIAYSAAKGGIVGLVRALARALAPKILVNGLAPGIILTGMPQHILRSARTARAPAGRDHAQALRRGARGRHGDPLPSERRLQLHHRPSDQRRWRGSLLMRGHMYVLVLAALAGC
jgi:3-oxoacyl-[acyl-carrier protein] reductase